MIKKGLLFFALCLAATLAHAQPAPSAYVPLAPCRAFDSRVSAGGSGPFSGTIHLIVREVCNIPEDATAISFAVTAVSPSAAGYLLVWEENLSRPVAASLTFSSTATSGGLTRLCYPLIECSNDIQIFVSQTTDVALDITGAYVPIEAATENHGGLGQ
jgi:hypothetical protein